MGRERVDSFTEAKHLSAEHKRVRPGKAGPDIHAGAMPTHGAAGQNMDGIVADYDLLTQYKADLLKHRDALAAHLATAAELSGPLADGTSPVTGPMRKAFHQRADAQEGVQRILQDYLDELDAVTAAIQNTLDTYRGVDGFAGSRFQRLANQEGAEG